MMKDVTIVLTVVLIGVLWHKQTPTETLKRVAEVCSNQCKAAGHEFGDGLYLNQTTKEVNCFCRKVN
jgi:hypothetical protein